MTSVDEEKRVVEYNVIQASSPIELAKLVNRAIREGWQPLGGVATAVSTPVGSPYFYQATRKTA